MMDGAEPRWLALSGTVTRYVTSGAGEPLFVLLHELGGSLESWTQVVPELAKHGRVLAIDARGAGMSQRVWGQVSMEDLRNDIASLLEALEWNGRAIVAGCAVGGAIALSYAANFPDRTAGVFAMSPAVGVPPERAAALLALADRVESEGAGVDIDARLAGSYPIILRTDMDRFLQLRARRIAADGRGVAATMRMLASLDMRDDFDRIRCPVRVVAGTYDAERTPETVRAIASKIPNAQFDELPTGHFMSVQTPQLVASELIRFSETTYNG